MVGWSIPEIKRRGAQDRYRNAGKDIVFSGPMTVALGSQSCFKKGSGVSHCVGQKPQAQDRKPTLLMGT